MPLSRTWHEPDIGGQPAAVLTNSEPWGRVGREYLIGHFFGGQNFRRTKFFGGQNFRHHLKISAVLSDENFSMVSYFPIHFTRKICFILIWHVLNFSGQNISADKIFGGQNFSADKIFGSNSDFRQFCPPKFCPIRYQVMVRWGSGFFQKSGRSVKYFISKKGRALFRKKYGTKTFFDQKPYLMTWNY